MNGLDLPPVWLASFIVLAWLLSRALPDVAFGIPGQGPVALVLIVGGLLLMALAVLEMMRAKTTFIPRKVPDALVTTGVFRFTRNPIYLGDSFVLAGAVLWLDAGPALVLVPVFIWVISHRFIRGEEAGLEREFGDKFDEWKQTTRRWI